MGNQTESGSTDNEVKVHDHGAIWICHGKIRFSKKLDVRPFLRLSVVEVEITMLCLCLKPPEQMSLCSGKDTDFWGNSSAMFYSTPFCPVVAATEVESNQWSKYENKCISYKNIHLPSLLKMEISDSLEPTCFFVSKYVCR